MTTRDRFRTWLSLALSATGVCLISYCVGVAIEARIVQDLLARRLEAAGSSDSDRSNPSNETRRLAITRGLVGRLEIPRLGVSAMITEGVTSKALRRGIGHVPNTAFPGEPGNVGLAAHRDTYFRCLSEVAEGDEIRLDTPDGSFSYEVEQTLIVDPDRIDLLEETASPVLTLVTCYPFYWVGNAPKRFVVRCRTIDDPAAPRDRDDAAQRRSPMLSDGRTGVDENSRKPL